MTKDELSDEAWRTSLSAIPITKLPPGKAKGVNDMKVWAQRRNVGFSGVPERKKRRTRRCRLLEVHGVAIRN